MITRILAALLFANALPVAAQSAPTADYSDMWWNPAESGWGLSLVQHPNNRVYAIWFTYDPREVESTTPGAGDFKPLWIVMNGGTWTSPTTLVGDAYVTRGTPFAQPWSSSGLRLSLVGTFTFRFTSASTGTFSYNIAPPPGTTSGDAAFGLPPLSGTKPIQRMTF